MVALYVRKKDARLWIRSGESELRNYTECRKDTFSNSESEKELGILSRSSLWVEQEREVPLLSSEDSLSLILLFKIVQSLAQLVTLYQLTLNVFERNADQSSCSNLER